MKNSCSIHFYWSFIKSSAFRAQTAHAPRAGFGAVATPGRSSGRARWGRSRSSGWPPRRHPTSAMDTSHSSAVTTRQLNLVPKLIKNKGFWIEMFCSKLEFRSFASFHIKKKIWNNVMIIKRIRKTGEKIIKYILILLAFVIQRKKSLRLYKR